MPLASGTKLGPYEIQSAIGAGGMGEVYRARDTRLGRDVAIKILPEHLSSSPDLRERFEREARSISSLNHPRICTLHDIGHQDGIDFLVMELLEGNSLAERLKKGPLPLKEALKIGMEVSEALEVAHRAGIIHRDLKPGNIMLTKSGAKLMDFGLAKAVVAELEAGTNAPLLSAAKTMSGPSPMSPLTTAGQIVGTIQYMSPEQIEGKPADARSDLFALGAVLYEMATGKRAFEGKSQISVASAILEKEPEPISAIQPLTPPTFEHVVNTCLAKNPDDRFQSARDVRLELKWSADGPQSGSTTAAPIENPKRSYIPWLVAALAFALAAAAAARIHFQPTQVPAPRARWVIEPPEKSTIHVTGDQPGSVAVSPDGQRVAFAAVDANGKQEVWVRPLDGLVATVVPGTEGGYFPFWSPDGNSLGFFSNRQLKRVSLDGGRAVPLCEVGLGRGASWSQQGIILFVPETNGPLYRISASGGTPAPVTQVDSSQHDSHRWPQFLPDGEHFLFFANGHNDLSHVHDGVYVGSLDDKSSKLVLHSKTNAAYASGHLLFLNESTLMAQAFDVTRLELTGEPVVAQEGVEADWGTWSAIFSASQNGVLAFAPTSTNSGNRLTWFSREGKALGVVGDLGRYLSLSLSPDGRVAAVEHSQPHHQIWLYDLQRNTSSQFTFGDFANASPIWSSDGKEIVFTSDRNGHLDLYRKSISGSAGETVMVQSPASKYPIDLSHDGKFLLFMESKQGKNALWVMPTAGQEPARLLVKDPFYLSDGSFSPDGQWVAYTSREQGGDHTFVMPVFGTGTKHQISFKGSTLYPLWRKDGRAIVYVDDQGYMIETDVTLHNSELSVGATRTLFRGNPEDLSTASRAYDIAPDGRFLINTHSQENQTQIVVISNWNAGLK